MRQVLSGAGASQHRRRCGDIREAAGATTVDKVHPTRVTGNCSHRHGSTRMGTDPDSSVLAANCRAHEVDNLFVVDGGPLPTAIGANPTLTMMAKAWRVADNIIAGGRP
jgi:choline dehydrogenase-like flavoprotein